MATKFKALLLQKLTRIKGIKIYKKYHRQINERYINTTHGKVRVLEIGFNNKEIQPLYVDLHSGGFVLMSADYNIKTNIELSQKAQVKIISIDYPKAPQYPYPIAIESIYEVIQTYKEVADVYRFDPKHIGIGGHSAGANLAAALVNRSRHLNKLSFKYQILLYPPLDLARKPELKKKVKGAVHPKLAIMYNESYVGDDKDKAIAPEISLIYTTKQDVEKNPKTLMILAGHDSLYDEGLEYAHHLKSANVDVELHEFMDSVHGFIALEKDGAEEAKQIMIDFMIKQK